MIAATLWSLLLPSVEKSIYFHHEKTHQLLLKDKTKHAFNAMWTHFKHGYANKHIIKWSVWWSLATCGFIQVQVYQQPLWTAIVNDPNQPIYNGLVEAVLTVLGFLGALFAGVLKVDWSKWGDVVLACCSLVQGFVMLASARTEFVILSYVSYVIFGALYHFVITIASSEIAKYIDEDSYGLIFGINTFAALVFQTILTVIVVTSGIGFALEPRSQFFVYGLFHVILGAIYFIIGLIGFFINERNSNNS